MPKDKEIKKLSEEDIENTSGGEIRYMELGKNKFEIYNNKGKYIGSSPTPINDMKGIVKFSGVSIKYLATILSDWIRGK